MTPTSVEIVAPRNGASVTSPNVGVPGPMPLYRLSQTSARLGNPRFEDLLGRLVDGSGEHREEVMGFLRGRA